jgi:hypothetical protein
MDAGRDVFDYLALRGAPPRRADVVIGFGHFDRKIPEQCADLVAGGIVDRVIFAGGSGVGSPGLELPESHFFRRVFRDRLPDFPDSSMVVEDRSTNTAENIVHCIELMSERPPEWRFGGGIRSAILVANAYRQRRVWLTCLVHLPGVQLYNCPPAVDYRTERAMFAERGEELNAHLVGEIDRLARYADRGWIVREPVPEGVLAAARRLRRSPED